MICKSPVLRLNRACEWFDCTKDFWIICGGVLREYFDVPEDAKRIQFFGYLKPGKKRVKVSRAKKDTSRYAKGQILYDGTWEYLVGDTEDLIGKLLDKHGTLYVECEYA